MWAASFLSAVVSLLACSPALNWRENQAEDTGIVTSFPCSPDRHARSVPLAGRAVRMEMLVCEAAGATYALSFFDADAPAAISPALLALRNAMVANLRAGPPLSGPFRLKGMTPNDQSARLEARGRGPDGSALIAQAAFFTKGLRVYQAAVVGAELPLDSFDPFFAGLRFPD